MKKVLTLVMAGMLTLLAGCGKGNQTPADNRPSLHIDMPPHGGTPVALGDDYKIEWVFDAPSGRLQAYILDGEMENFVRIAADGFDLNVQIPNGQATNLHFQAVANTATGETVGNTSLFESSAACLRAHHRFDATLRQIEVKGTLYTNVTFTFPTGGSGSQ